MNVAIVVAAGSGSRFGGTTPKQFLDLGGKPLIVHTLERFQACPDIDRIILVLPENDLSAFIKKYEEFTLSKIMGFAVGGETRAESVWNGFSAIGEAAEVVAIHDGARPLVTAAEISACINKAKDTGAAILAAPVTDTIKEIRDGRIVRTIDRSNLRRALTPQCFRYEILQRAFANADFGAAVTDESFLVEKLGIEVAVVEGSATNIKVTTPEDLRLVESFLKNIT
jgi:2-C-methyl-D-erythritol 4-phosphate cytidylyltransferase